LALVGAAYALWFEDLTLTANVATGTFNANASIEDIGPGDNEGLPVVAQNPTNSVAALVSDTTHYGDFAAFPANKPPTTCDGVVTTSDDPNHTQANDSVSDNELDLTLGGLYPYAGCEFTIDIDNAGTVPFHVSLTGVSLELCNISGSPCTTAPEAPWSIGLAPDSDPFCYAFLGAIVDWTGDSIPIEVNGVPLQLHAGNSLDCTFKLILDQNPSVENTLWKFSAIYEAHQWNENIP
jgi:hypothetical protein